MKINSPSAAQTAIAPQQGQKIPTGNAPKESVGDIANRVANSGKPSGRRIQGAGSPQLDKDAFFKLMLAQVKNQDPTNPMKNHEMAAQLAQFSSLEQMSNVNETLKQMQRGQGEGNQFQALDLMGKMVRGDSGKLSRAQNETSHEVSYNLKDAASMVNISIANAQGEVVKNLTIQNAPQGPGKIQWDGKSEEGVVQPAGQYKISVNAKDAAGQKVNTETEFSGKVTGVQFTEAGPIVSIGKKTVPLKDIKQVEEGNLQNSSPEKNAAASLQKMVPSSARLNLPKDSALPSGMEEALQKIDMASLQNSLNTVKK